MKILSQSKKKRIALIGYAGEYFKCFGEALEEIGFEVYWVCSTRSEAVFLRKNALIPSNRILDTTIGFKGKESNIEESHIILSKLEYKDKPRVYDIILMDRVLRHKKTTEALAYIVHLDKVLLHFFIKNEISLVSSGRDTALQLMSMIVSNKLGIPWVVPTRLRIPMETYGFCTGPETDNFIKLFNPQKTDSQWAETILKNFNNFHYRPALKVATRNFRDVIFMIPIHLATFAKLLKQSYWDWGNDYSNYSIKKTIFLYIRRRINMLGYKLFSPYSPIGTKPFCIYALHTQPESSIDVAGSYFSDQIALITYIARSLPASHELYVKVHPTDVDGKPLSFYKRIKRIPGVRLINYDVSSRDLVKKASIVFTLTGTIGYEAGLMGKQVITFAKNFYNDLPTVNYCDAPPRLPYFVDHLINKDTPDNSEEQILNFLKDYRCRIFDGEVNRGYGEKPTTLNSQDLVTLQKAYDHLYNIMVKKNSPDTVNRP